MPIEMIRLPIEEGNRRIAEFMGYEVERMPDASYRIKHIADRYWSKWDHPWSSSYRTPYHCQWDWLMPVVEKIESKEFGYWSVMINRESCAIHDYVDHESGPCFEISSELISFRDLEGKGAKIQAVWHAVVNWITWYNNVNNTSTV